MKYRIGIDIRLLNVPRHTGISRYLKNIVREICANSGEDYHLIGLPPPSLIPQSAHLIGIDLPMDNGLDGQKLLALSAWAEQLDLLFCPYFIPPRRLHCPTVLTVADLIPLRHPEWFASSALGDFFRLEFREACERADHVIAVSEATKNDLIELYQLPEDKISVVLDAADPIFSCDDEELYSSTSDKISFERPYILSVCTLEPRKNLKRIIEAYTLLRRQNSSLSPLLVLTGGLGWNYDDIFKAIDKSPYREDVRLTGFVDDIYLAKLYRQAQLFVYPSLYEGFGLPIIEAMASGTAVVTAANSSLPEVGGEAVMYCDPLSVDSIAQSMGKLLKDNQLRDTFCLAGLEQADKFSWQETARQTRDVLLQVLETRS